MTSNYTIIHNGDWVAIKDLGPWDEYKTVTNDIENVVKSLSPLLNNRRLYYVDSELDFSRIHYKGDRFIKFTKK